MTKRCQIFLGCRNGRTKQACKFVFSDAFLGIFIDLSCDGCNNRSLILFKCPLWNGIWTNPGRGINHLNGTVVVQVSHREFQKFSLSIKKDCSQVTYTYFRIDGDLILVCILLASEGLELS